MPPQIKQDLNRSGWESTDFPSVCETCLPENPYVKMIKEDYGAECKLCTRPFTVFAWSATRAHGRKKRTNICLTCARLKNCCQCCMLDLSFGLPIVVRDAALKMVAPGPQSDINREYFAQNNEKLIEEGKAGTEEYEKTDEKARELLRRLANSKPYFRKGKTIEDAGEGSRVETQLSALALADLDRFEHEIQRRPLPQEQRLALRVARSSPALPSCPRARAIGSPLPTRTSCHSS
ncbi:Pre-mRNA-splicing factor slt11 [Fusarium falciforme]|nr:Pre-mRNA-splicing factor slt11 [Fusarium falciforme]